MPKKKKPRINKQRMKVLDDLGEDEVFDLYAKTGTIRKMMIELGNIADIWQPAQPGTQTGATAFYRWLQAEDGRRLRWKNFKRWLGDEDAEEAVEIAMSATQEDWQEKRLKYDAKKWSASVRNREDYGDGGQKVLETVGAALLQAMMKADQIAEERRLEASNPIEADFEVEEG